MKSLQGVLLFACGLFPLSTAAQDLPGVQLETVSSENIIEEVTLNGTVKLKVPAETQSGKMFRLRGKGVTSVRGGAPGDLLCKVVIETPVKLSSEQKDLLRQFQDSLENGGDRHNPRKSSWFEGVKRFFDTK